MTHGLPATMVANQLSNALCRDKAIRVRLNKDECTNCALNSFTLAAINIGVNVAFRNVDDNGFDVLVKVRYTQ